MSTKKLAKQLGLLRQRSQSSGSKKTLVSNQTFSYLIVIDFESTCWQEKNNYSQEIIEFPAVLLNTSTGDVESEFHTYVQPQEHPILSRFCTELTGITQVQVESGIPLQICLSKFNRWLQNLYLEKKVVFPENQKKSSAPLPTQKLCTFVTWSDWDLGVCLQYECKRKQLHKPEVLNSWIDLRSTYRLFYSRKPKGLNGALQDLGIQFSGREHSGLDDSRNTARLAARMMRDGCVMKVTRSLDRSSVMDKPKVGKTTCSVNKAGRPNTENTLKTSKLTSFKTPHGAPKIQPRSDYVTKHSDTKENSSSAELSLPAYQSLISPKTLLNGSTAPLWGRGRKSVPGEDDTRSSRSVVMDSTSPHNIYNQSLVLCSTTMSNLSNLPRLHQASETGFTSGVVDEDRVEPVVEAEESCGSYDDVVLEGEDTDFILNCDSGCYEWEESDDAHSQRRQFKSGDSSTKNMDVGNDSKMQKNTSGSSAKAIKTHVMVSNSVKEMKLRSSTSNPEPCFTVPKPVTRSKTQLKTLVQLQGTSVGPRRNCKTNVPSLFTPKPFVSEKTSTPHTSFARPRLVIPPLRHQETLKSSFTIYTEPTKQPAGRARPSSGGSLQTPNNALSTVTNTRSSCSTRSFTCATTKGGQRVTSPLCGCGRRAKRQVVSNGGPNHGRGFFCCPVRRSRGSKVEKGCQFFKWESAVMRSSSVGVQQAVRSSVSLCQFDSTLPLHSRHGSSLRKSY